MIYTAMVFAWVGSMAFVIPFPLVTTQVEYGYCTSAAASNEQLLGYGSSNLAIAQPPFFIYKSGTWKRKEGMAGEGNKKEEW